MTEIDERIIDDILNEDVAEVNLIRYMIESLEKKLHTLHSTSPEPGMEKERVKEIAAVGNELLRAKKKLNEDYTN